MNTILTRRVMIQGQAVELWESPDSPFDPTGRGLAYYAAREDWIAIFNVLTLHATPAHAE